MSFNLSFSFFLGGAGWARLGGGSRLLQSSPTDDPFFGHRDNGQRREMFACCCHAFFWMMNMQACGLSDFSRSKKTINNVNTKVVKGMSYYS